MRYLVGFVFVLALCIAGCGETAYECSRHSNCDDQSVCTDDLCVDGFCRYSPLSPYDRPRILPCELEEGSGFCIAGECEENPCVPDNSCTDEEPAHSDGWCERTRIDPDGTPCEANGVVGVCINVGIDIDIPPGDSIVCSEHDPCEGVVCGDPLCTDNTRWVYYCDYGDGGACKQKAVSCSDGNQCTEDRCDPETGECFNPLVPDGRSCCNRYEEHCGSFCIPPCCTWYCVAGGSCDQGVCVE